MLLKLKSSQLEMMEVCFQKRLRLKKNTVNSVDELLASYNHSPCMAATSVILI